MVTLNLDKVFNPKSVAIMGASAEEGSIGYSIVKNLTQLGYAGKVYLVNAHKPEILGVKAFQTIEQIPEHVDLAVIATPAKTVPDIVEQCGRVGVKGAIIVSTGFKEARAERKALEEQILEARKKYGIRIIGPNCIGVICPRINLNATFLDKMPKPGKVAFITQSGALGSAILDWAIHKNIGFSNFVSVGSMIDVDFGDLIDYFGTDPQTRSILLYMENLTEARKFMSAARHFARTKPIIVVKAGKFSESAKTAVTHIGSLSTEDAIYEAAFKRAGIVRVEEIEDLFNTAEVLENQPLPKGPSIAIITNAGSLGIMATDALIAKGGRLANLSKKTIEALNGVLPPSWSKSNPLDILGDADAERYRTALEACLNDENVDGILIIFTQQSMAEPIEIAKNIVELIKSKTYQNKTILTNFMGYGAVQEANRVFNENNIPTYSTPEHAIKAYMYMYQYKRNLELIYETPEELPVDAAPPKRPILNILRSAAVENRELLTDIEAKKILEYYNFPVVKTAVAATADEAVAFAKQMGYPVVLKILSPSIIYKTDADSVILDINSDAEVRKAFELLMQRAKVSNEKANIIGVTVQPMIRHRGYEVIIGGKKDPTFGPAILFGMGGVGAELFKDYSIGLPPLNTTLIRRMLEETKVYQLLRGYRNIPPANLKLLEEVLLRFSQLLIDFPQIREIDLNPLLISEKEASVLDARIAIDKEAVFRKFEPHEHLVISPYPKKYETLWTLRNGQEVLLRPIKPEDEPLWLEMFQSFSEESIRYRFFQVIKDTPHEVRVRYCNIDYDREIAIVAELTEEGRRRILGVARLSIEPDGKNGELAFIVTDKWQGLGLGTKMVDYVLEIAKEMGVETVYAIMLADNKRALSLTQKMGFTLEYLNDGTVKGVLNLKDENVKCGELARLQQPDAAEKQVSVSSKEIGRPQQTEASLLKEGVST